MIKLYREHGGRGTERGATSQVQDGMSILVFIFSRTLAAAGERDDVGYPYHAEGRLLMSSGRARSWEWGGRINIRGGGLEKRGGGTSKRDTTGGGS